MPLKEKFKHEVADVVKKLKEFRRLLPNAVINYYEGNHEFRFLKYLTKNAPALWDMLDLPHLFQLEELNINWIPYEKDQLGRVCGSDLFIRHEPYKATKHAAVGSIYEKHISLCAGHTHRPQDVLESTVLKNYVECHVSGWLGDPQSPVVKYLKNPESWAQSFQVCTIFSKEDFFVDSIYIKNYKASYEGFFYYE